MTPARSRALAVTSMALAVGLVSAGCGGSPASTSAAPPSAGPTVPGSATPDTATPDTATPDTATLGSAAPSSTVGTRQACALVTLQEVRAALPTNPGAGKAFSSHGSSQCQFGSYQTGFVLVNLTPTQGVAAYDLLHSNSKPAPSMKMAEVSGVGDRAFGITGPNTASIYFDEGDALILIMVEIPKATTPPADQVLALARAAAGRA